MKCKTCLKDKPGSEFYRASKSKCKECTKARVRENYREKIDQYKAYDRQRAMLPHRVEARNKYLRTEQGKARSNEAKKRWQEANIIKRAAHIITGNAIRDGKLTKQPCEVCGKTKVQAHHDDYEQPLQVRWLCPKHHAEHHKAPE